MLSKQDKLKYGQQLRRQMKQKQEKKRIDDMQKRGIRRSPTDTRIPIESQPYVDNKQMLQNRFEGQNVDYYGRPGGGAPNRQPAEQNSSGMQPSYNYYDQNQMGRQKTQQQYPAYQGEAGMHQNNNYNQQQRQPPPYDNYRGNNDQQYYQKPAMGYQPIQQPMYAQQQLPQQQSFSNNPSAPASFNQRVPTDRSFPEPPQQIESRVQPPYGYGYAEQKTYQSIQPPAQYQAAYQPDSYQDPIQEINQKHQAFRQKTKQNEQLMEIHKKGGRNLLQLQNMTIDQQQIKQKQKQQMRRQLQQQMKEVEQRKKQQIQRIKRQQLQEQRKNQQYILRKKRQLQQQEMKKQNKQRQLMEQNAKNLQQRRRLQQQAKQKAMRQRNKQQAPVQASVQNSPKMNKKQAFSRQSQFQLPSDQTTSQVSSSTVMQKGFNTGVSKQFFQNQRRKDQDRYNRQKNLEVVTDEIKRLKEQIDQQNHMFMKQIQKVKLQSQMAEHEKKKAEQQIQNLKMQLKRKMQQDNQRLFMALQRQESLVQQNNEYEQPRRNNDRRQPPPQQYQYTNNSNVESLKPQRDEKLVKKQYAMPQQQAKRESYNQKLAESNISEEGMLTSLHGDSKKIPINLPEDKLSMSRLSDFARQTSFFKNDGKTPYLNQNQKRTNLKVHESIVQEEQDRGDSRVAPRKQPTRQNHKDQLDKFVERQKSRDGGAGWGELSSVNSDITKQIQQLLKKKDTGIRPPSSTKYDNPYNYNRPPSGNKYDNPYNPNGRPSSNLSNAGKRTLSRNGLEYDGASLGTINSIAGGNGTLGTVDIDRIHNRNQKRLNELKNLGVETINTNNGDEEFSKLDMILNKYKQSRVL